MSDKEQETICAMFDRIAPTYDMVNRILSFGQDIGWRKAVAKKLPNKADLFVLDVATGTADLLLAMAASCHNIKEACGVDLADNMLAIGRTKINDAGLKDRFVLQRADACELPFSAEQFDVVTIAFGIRNVPYKERAIQQFARVLKQDGLLLILEFSLPHNSILRSLYLAYFRYVLPFVGGILSKDRKAYRYLNRSVEAFFDRHSFSDVLLKNGFNTVELISLTFGIATIYCARKG